MRSSTSLGLARSLAALSAVMSTATWVAFVFVDPLGGMGVAGPPAWIAAVLFPGLALAGLVATFRDAPLVTLITGLVALFPVGVWFLLAPGVFRLIGVAPVLMVAAGWVLLRRMRVEEEGETPEP